MKTYGAHKPVTSTFIAIGFAVISITGALLFFHVKNGPIVVMHQWFGWLFTAVGVYHVMLNLTPLLAYLTQRRGLLSALAALALAIGFGIAGLHHKGPPRERGQNIPSAAEQHP